MQLEPRRRPACPICGITATSGAAIAEHVYHSHGGEEPAHWIEAERRAGLRD
jgi:hypothetical protein